MKSFCFQLNRRNVLTLLLAIFFALPAFSQQLTVQGTVIDENGEPVIGASVVASSGAGAATDFDGKFTLNVSSDAVLTVSYVGYSPQEVAVNGKSDILVKLSPSSVVLDEVVAIGYGVVKK